MVEVASADDDSELMSAADDTRETAPQPAPKSFEDRYNALTSSAPVGIYELTLDGTWVFANDRCYELAGTTREAGAGHGWLEAIHPDDRGPLAEEWARAVESRQEFELEYRFLHGDGRVVWVFGQATYLRGREGEVAGLLGTLTDITAQRCRLLGQLAGGDVRERSQ